MSTRRGPMLVGAAQSAPTADSTASATTADVVGNKADTVAGDSVIALTKRVLNYHYTEQICLGNSGGVLAEDALASFQLTSGTSQAWGTELQIYAGAFGSGVAVDLDRVLVTGVQRTGDLYVVEFYAGTGVFGAAERVTGFYFQTSTATFRSGESTGRSCKVRGDLNLWGRCKCANAAASTIDMVFIAHKTPSDTGTTIP